MIKKRDEKGRIMLLSMEEKFWDKVNKKSNDGCWYWVGSKDKKGYGILIEYREGKRYKSHLAHRLSYELNIGNIPIGMVICHKCDNPSCVNPNHLFIGTQQDNVDDMMRKDRYARGEQTSSKGSKNGASKLNESQVKEIRNKYLPRKYTTKKLAEEYGVSVALIEKIVGNKLWKHVI